MANKPKRSSQIYSEEGYPRKSIDCKAGSNDADTACNYARLLTSSSLAAFRVLKASEHKTGLDEMLDVPALMKVLEEQTAAVNCNDLAQVEAMLMNQATALQSLFARLTEKALDAEYVSTFDTMMKMSLRAQSQCRATLETLAAIKNPPLVIAKQANVTSGPQQINNGVEAFSRARENENVQSKLSGGNNELLPNTGTPCVESETYSTLETVGEVNRAKVRRGKG